MHADSGLWKLCAEAQALGTVAEVGAVDARLAGWLVMWGANKPQLAGSTISFDRAFMARHLPISHALLHYRNLDVTTLNEIYRRFAPKIHADRPRDNAAPAHRAMQDARASLTTLRYYLGHMIPAA